MGKAKSSTIWSWIVHVAKWLKGGDTSRGEPAPKKAWTVELIQGLAGGLGNREPRLILLFCDGGRPTVSGQELSAKFGCGDPFDADRDLPQAAEFCRKHQLPIPIVASGGTPEKPAYTLTWSPAQREAFAATQPQVV